MRVLMISSNWAPVTRGGAEAYVADLTQMLRSRGHDVGALTLGIAGPDVVEAVRARPHGLDSHTRRPPVARVAFHGVDVWRPDTPRALTRAVRRFAPDVVHSHVVAGMSVAALTTPAKLGVPHVHTLHDHWLRCWRSTGTTRRQGACGPACAAIATLRAAALRRSAPHVVIAISNDLRRRHAASIPPAADVRVLHHPAAAPDAPRPVRPPHAPPVFGFLGQLNPNKGVRTLLDAAAAMAPQEARFVVAGAGRLEAEVAARSSDQLEYRGWVNGTAKERFFADIDCLVVPSLWAEPAGLVVGEAAVRGVPVIAAEVGGLPEYVPPSCRDLLFPPGDAERLVQRLRTFAASPSGFAVDPAAVRTWDEHCDDITAAYDRARQIVDHSRPAVPA